jgi:DNA-binding GntR family transcriptional regulator
MAASHRAWGKLASTSLHGGEADLQMRARFLLDLGAATGNPFMASIISTTVLSLMADAPYELDNWSAWLMPQRAARLVELIRNGDSDAASEMAGKGRETSTAA